MFYSPYLKTCLFCYIFIFVSTSAVKATVAIAKVAKVVFTYQYSNSSAISEQLIIIILLKTNFQFAMHRITQHEISNKNVTRRESGLMSWRKC